MSDQFNDQSKETLLKKNGAFNYNSDKVKDKLFKQYDFFDPCDLFQVKYEMVRRVQKDNLNVAKASNSFGFSRTSFYQIQKTIETHGLSGLIPHKKGPKTPHKLTDDVMKFIDMAIAEDNSIRSVQLAELIEKHFRFSIHPRTIEKAINQRKKKERGKNGKD